MGELTEKAKAAGNKISGATKEGIGGATGNESLRAEGKAQQAKGDVQHAKGTIKGALGDDI